MEVESSAGGRGHCVKDSIGVGSLPWRRIWLYCCVPTSPVWDLMAIFCLFSHRGSGLTHSPKDLFYFYLCASRWMYMLVPWKAEEGVRSPRALVIGGHGTSDPAWVLWPRVLWESRECFSHWVISPGTELCTLRFSSSAICLASHFISEVKPWHMSGCNWITWFKKKNTLRILFWHKGCWTFTVGSYL